MAGRRRSADLAWILRAAEAASPVDAVEGVARELGSMFDAVAVSFLITDLSGRALVRLAQVPRSGGPADESPSAPRERRADGESATVLPFDGGPEEQAVRTQTVQVLAAATPGRDREEGDPGLWRVLAPVTERGESIGLLELHLPTEPGDDVLAEVAQVGHLLAFVVIANRRHTDLFEWGQRSQTFNLSAEIQQRLLPGARTCEASAFTLSGWLEPAASIGGDTFDYSLARDLLHLSLTDAMGHGVDSALTASMCLGGLRGARRRGRSLVEQAHETNDALFEHASRRGGDDFASGLIARVDLVTGSMEIVNAGHVPPYLLRGSTLNSFDLTTDLPFGLFADSTYSTTTLSLNHGDRVVFVTDGMLERNVASIDLPRAIQATADLHPREVVRALADSALDAAGHELPDDATVICLDWHGTHDTARESEAGADPSRTSTPLDDRLG